MIRLLEFIANGFIALIYCAWALLALSFLAMGGLLIWHACLVEGGAEASLGIRVLVGLVGLAMVVYTIRSLWRWFWHEQKEGTLRNAFKPKVRNADLTAPAQCRIERPFAVLRQQFLETAPHDPLVLADEESSFISWNNGQSGIIQIQSLDNNGREGNGDEDDEWIALFWQNDSGGRILTDKQLESLCLAEKVELPAHFRRMDAEGFAHYRKGRLAIYPSALKAGFEDSFLRSLLATPKAFRQWLDELIEDEEHAD